MTPLAGGHLARVGPTTPTRAARLADASVDPTEARNVLVLSPITAPVDAVRIAHGTRGLASKSAHDPHCRAFVMEEAPRGLLPRTGLMFEVRRGIRADVFVPLRVRDRSHDAEDVS